MQSWRTSEFAADAPDSRIEVSFANSEDDTILTLKHSDLQPGDGDKYKQGWEESYFEPMRAYYGERAV